MPCPVPAGGATLHHSYLLHYAGANRSKTPRRAYIIKFGLPSVARETPVDNYWMKDRDTERERRRKRNAESRAAKS